MKYKDLPMVQLWCNGINDKSERGGGRSRGRIHARSTMTRGYMRQPDWPALLAVSLLSVFAGALESAQGRAVGLRLRGGARDLKIEHRAFVANLPRTLTDKGLKEAFAEFGKIKEARVRHDILTISRCPWRSVPCRICAGPGEKRS